MDHRRRHSLLTAYLRLTVAITRAPHRSPVEVLLEDADAELLPEERAELDLLLRMWRERQRPAALRSAA
jgi:hypothetical protein